MCFHHNIRGVKTHEEILKDYRTKPFQSFQKIRLLILNPILKKPKKRCHTTYEDIQDKKRLSHTAFNFQTLNLHSKFQKFLLPWSRNCKC